MNTKPRHTPGKWEVEPVGSEIYINDGKDVDICHVLRPYPSRGEAIGTDEQVAEWQEKTRAANARLISAAPELLNMLARMVDETSGGNPPCLLTLEHARAAIAKAKGQTADWQAEARA